MLLATVIILLVISIADNSVFGFRRYYSRSVDANQYPVQSPCPSVFQYGTDENGNLIGNIRVDQSDADGRVTLEVEMSVGNTVQGYNGKIVLAEDRQKVINDIMNRKPIFYKVLFPAWQTYPPTITKILVNGNQICSGPRIPIQMVPVLTMINLQHKLTLGVTPLISSSDPTVDSSTLFNNLPSAANSQGNQNTQYELDVRVDKYPNNVYAININPNRRPDSTSNPFFNANNPYGFNPDGPPPPPPNGRPPPPNNRGPPPSNNGRPPPPPPYDGRPPPRYDGRPPPPPPERPGPYQGQINPQNPFLNGLSTPQPSRGDTEIQVNGNQFFFDQGTDPPVVIQPTTARTELTSATTVNKNVNEICGRPLATNSLVVNGATVARGAYPWLVAIFKQLENLSLSYICSGSLISDRHVVTAAHCVKLEYRRVKPSEIVCVFGKLNIRKWVTAQGERMLEPESITIHPDYETGKANADIAVMTFPDTIPFSRMIMPVCLWQGDSDLNKVVGDIGSVVGWGRDENGDVSTAEPRLVNMPIVDQLECLKGSSSIAGQALVEIVSKNTFCAGFRNGSGPCNGDSGSAFLLRKNGVFYLRGIVSTALSEATHRSCNLQEYVVFTDASKYKDWLLDILKIKPT